jgi:hypothetical protein
LPEQARKPLLLLDVDGVCCPFGAGEGAPVDLERVDTGGSGVLLSPATGPFLRELGTLFELCWASGWEHEANLRVCPLLGLPPLPVIVFANWMDADDLDDESDAVGTWKLPAVKRVVGSRPLAWIDDELAADAFAWAAERDAAGSPTLLVKTASHVGLTVAQVEQLAAFARGQPI